MATKGPKLKTTPFEVHGSRLDVGKRWKKWLQRFERELLYQGIDSAEKPKMAQMTLLIHIGNDAEDIHDSLPTPVKPEGLTDAQWTDYQKSVSKFNNYFLPQQSNDFAIFELMNVKPLTAETTKSYAARLREAADKCVFTDWSAEKMIKCILIFNLADEDLRLSCLQKAYTLQQIIDKSSRKEDAKEMNKKMMGEEINKVGNGGKTGQGPSGPTKKKANPGSWSKQHDTGTCRNCSGDRHKDFKK